VNQGGEDNHAQAEHPKDGEDEERASPMPLKE
jgi:hypothetical protein